MAEEQNRFSFMDIGNAVGRVKNEIIEHKTEAYPGKMFREPLKGIPTGFPDIDVNISGLNPGLTVAASRSCIYLPDFLNSVALHAALEKKLKVLYLSLTPAYETILERMFLSECRISFRNAYTSEALSERDLNRMEHIENRFKGLEEKIFITNSPRDIRDFEEILDFIKKEKGLDLAIIDNFQVLRYGGENSRENEVAENSAKALEEISYRMKVPFLLASEINEENKKRIEQNEPLLMNDLKNFPALQYRARPALLFYRQKYADEDDEESIYFGSDDFFGISVRIENNRYGVPCSTVPLTYLSTYGKLESAAKVDLSDAANEGVDKKRDIEIVEEANTAKFKD